MSSLINLPKITPALKLEWRMDSLKDALTKYNDVAATQGLPKLEIWEYMTLEEIIEYYEKTGALGPKGYGIAEMQLRTAKLLRAGQKMRNALQFLKDTEGFYAPNSCKAWDETTREDV